ncbi:hypothetical protein RIdsm_02496 [Roseovarius indicus]|uniref:Uncharacterized protein n=1 Tax=Roseovarius indicus TaxID=540747 RepID=A0A5P3AD48_9RHOB|nr:hypothetical protein RIdsm_02496 [Roseovarius indicus]SFD61547.1 hypothetical protein SAMN04488031_101846 [Roseovarius indicus]
MDRDALRELLDDAESQTRNLWIGYNGEVDPVPQIDRILERQIRILKALIAEGE